MTRTKPWIVLAIMAVFALTALAPGMALASAASRQKNKNLWRNLAIGSGVIAGYGLIHHNTTATILGAAGAAYSANRYEQDRRSQAQHQRWRERYYRGRYNQGRYYHHDYRYSRDYGHDRYSHDRNRHYDNHDYRH